MVVVRPKFIDSEPSGRPVDLPTTSPTTVLAFVPLWGGRSFSVCKLESKAIIKEAANKLRDDGYPGASDYAPDHQPISIFQLVIEGVFPEINKFQKIINHRNLLNFFNLYDL